MPNHRQRIKDNTTHDGKKYIKYYPENCKIGFALHLEQNDVTDRSDFCTKSYLVLLYFDKRVELKPLSLP